MFEITEDTRNAAIAEMHEIFIKADVERVPDVDDIGEAFDKAVEIVKKQFGF